MVTAAIREAQDDAVRLARQVRALKLVGAILREADVRVSMDELNEMIAIASEALRNEWRNSHG